MNIIKFYKNLSKTEKRNINLGLCYLVVILTILLIIFFKFTDFKVLDIELIKSIGKQTEYFVKKNFILSLIIYGFFIFFGLWHVDLCLQLFSRRVLIWKCLFNIVNNIY